MSAVVTIRNTPVRIQNTPKQQVTTAHLGRSGVSSMISRSGAAAAEHHRPQRAEHDEQRADHVEQDGGEDDVHDSARDLGRL